MILFINVFITNKRVKTGLEISDRLNVFKYMLSSIATIDCWSKAVIYCQLDREFENRWNEVEEHIRKEFIGTPLSIYPYRSDTQKKWQAACKPILEQPDDLIWFLCNDDHIFIDSNLELLHEVIGILKQDKSKYKSFYFSHWPEPTT